MKEVILTDKRYTKVVSFLTNSCKALSESLSDKTKYNQAMTCLEFLSSVENTQYDEQYEGISIMLTDSQMEQLICCLIDFIPFKRIRGKD